MTKENRKYLSMNFVNILLNFSKSMIIFVKIPIYSEPTTGSKNKEKKGRKTWDLQSTQRTMSK